MTFPDHEHEPAANPLEAAPVVVTIRTETVSGNAKTHVNLTFGAVDLDTALRLIRRATDGAPLLKHPEEGQN